MEVYLSKKNQNGKEVFWSGNVIKNIIHISYGAVGGKVVKQQKVIKAGKNVGKKNETTPVTQALFELNSLALKKIESGYTQTGGTTVTVDAKKNKAQLSTAPVPMTAYVASDHVKKISNQKLYVQYKYDGFRCVYDVKLKKLYSRSQKEFVSLPYLVDYLSSNVPKDYPFDYVDGELYSHSLSFEKISSIVASRKKVPDEATQSLISFVAFDTFSLNDSTPFEQRYATLKEKLSGKSYLRVAETYTLKPQVLSDSLIELQQDLSYAEKKGYEGIMLRLNKPYEHRRSYSIYKMKNFFDLEGVCIGFKEEENKYNVLGAVIFKLPSGVTVDGRPAMTAEQKAEIWNNKEKYLGKVGTLKYQEKTTTGAPRFPVFTHWRPSVDLAKKQ